MQPQPHRQARECSQQNIQAAASDGVGKATQTQRLQNELGAQTGGSSPWTQLGFGRS